MGRRRAGHTIYSLSSWAGFGVRLTTRPIAPSFHALFTSQAPASPEWRCSPWAVEGGCAEGKATEPSRHRSCGGTVVCINASMVGGMCTVQEGPRLMLARPTSRSNGQAACSLSRQPIRITMRMTGVQASCYVLATQAHRGKEKIRLCSSSRWRGFQTCQMQPRAHEPPRLLVCKRGGRSEFLTNDATLSVLWTPWCTPQDEQSIKAGALLTSMAVPVVHGPSAAASQCVVLPCPGSACVQKIVYWCMCTRPMKHRLGGQLDVRCPAVDWTGGGLREGTKVRQIAGQ